MTPPRPMIPSRSTRRPHPANEPPPGPTAAAGPIRPAVSGIVLAGGRSRRFGGDKLGALVDGRPLLQRSVEAVGSVCREVLVVLAPDAPEPDLPAGLSVPLRFVRDPQPFGGPLVGIAAALAEASQPVALVVGGDMPWLEGAVLTLLVSELEASRCQLAALVNDDRAEQLPIAVSVPAARAAAERLVGAGERRLTALQREIETRLVDEATWRRLDPHGRSLRDVDRPSDLADGGPGEPLP